MTTQIIREGSSPGPRKLTIAGTPCERVGESMQLKGQTFDTYQPVNEDDSRLFERIRESGRILQTR